MLCLVLFPLYSIIQGYPHLQWQKSWSVLTTVNPVLKSCFFYIFKLQLINIACTILDNLLLVRYCRYIIPSFTSIIFNHPRLPQCPVTKERFSTVSSVLNWFFFHIFKHNNTSVVYWSKWYQRPKKPLRYSGTLM